LGEIGGLYIGAKREDPTRWDSSSVFRIKFWDDFFNKPRKLTPEVFEKEIKYEKTREEKILKKIKKIEEEKKELLKKIEKEKKELLRKIKIIEGGRKRIENVFESYKETKK